MLATKDEETRKVRVDLRGSRDQKGNRANERAVTDFGHLNLTSLANPTLAKPTWAYFGQP